jgi:plasmid stability protein
VRVRDGVGLGLIAAVMNCPLALASHAMSSTLTVRNLDEGVKARLRIRAAENGRSMEAEARAILRDSLLGSAPTERLGTWIHERFADVGGVELDLPRRDELARAADQPG